jgi:glutamyl-tRNA(Gln) amidotransferase subunit E
MAIQEIKIRAKEATLGIPSETRQALADGTNGFERILPGADRMYPDTDLPPLEISQERIARLEKNIPETIWERKEKYQRMGIPEHMQTEIASSPKAILFESIVNDFNIPVTWVVRYLFESAKAWKRKGLPVEKLEDQIWRTFFGNAQKKEPLLEKGEDIFEDYLKQKKMNVHKVIDRYITDTQMNQKFQPLLETIINNETEDIKDSEKKYKVVMGKMMAHFRGYIQGKVVSERVKKKLKIK